MLTLFPRSLRVAFLVTALSGTVTLRAQPVPLEEELPREATLEDEERGFFDFLPFVGGERERNRNNPLVQTRESSEDFRKAQEALAEGREGRALDLFEDVYDDYPLSRHAPESLFQYATIRYERQQWKKSFEAFQRLLVRYPEFPRFNEVLRIQFDIATALAEGRNVKFLYVIPYKAYNRSVRYFETVVFNGPYGDLAPLALMNVALIHERTGDIPRAIDSLDRLINNYPNSLLADDAYLQLADTFAALVDGPHYDQGATREALSYYQDFLILFPDNEVVGAAEQGAAEMEDVYARSKLVIGEYYYRHRNWYRAAEIFFNEAITTAPESPSADRARQYLARIEEFKVLAANDPEYRPPRNTWGELIMFWRERDIDLGPEADPGVDADSQPIVEDTPI